MRRTISVLGIILLAGWGCQDDPDVVSITQETVLSLSGQVIPASGTGELNFPGQEGREVFIEVDSIDPLAEPSFRVIRGDVSCDDEVPDEDLIISVPDDRRPGEAQDAFVPPTTGDYTLCYTDDNNAPGQTSYRILITQDAR